MFCQSLLVCVCVLGGGGGGGGGVSNLVHMSTNYGAWLSCAVFEETRYGY